jgi:catechol 2,3-dioxygenase-like lactoylglutathione lyase family enzyme
MDAMNQTLASVAVLVWDYDEAIAYYTTALGFELLEDTPLGGGKRWVRVAPRGSKGSSILLAKASNEQQLAAVGNQTGGRVFLLLHTDDFWRDYHAFQTHGVHFLEEPREETYGTVAVFADCYGNKWDLIEAK